MPPASRSPASPLTPAEIRDWIKPSGTDALERLLEAMALRDEYPATHAALGSPVYLPAVLPRAPLRLPWESSLRVPVGTFANVVPAWVEMAPDEILASLKATQRDVDAGAAEAFAGGSVEPLPFRSEPWR